MSKTAKNYPDIGKVIEDFARERKSWHGFVAMDRSTNIQWSHKTWSEIDLQKDQSTLGREIWHKVCLWNRSAAMQCS